MEKTSQTKLFQSTKVKGVASTHPILEIDLLRTTLKDFMPSLVFDPIKHQATLDQIHSFLFKSKPSMKLQNDLEQAVGEELFITLLGLKSFLCNHNLRVIELSLEESKRQFKAFLNQELEA